jgi:hypothetical protein
MTPEQLALLLGAILSLVFAYFPWVKDWFDGLDSVWKPLLNAGLLLALALALVGLGHGVGICLNLLDYFECSQVGVIDALLVWLLALVGNQAAYLTFVRQFKQR